MNADLRRFLRGERCKLFIKIICVNLRPSAVKASFFFASIRVHSRLIDVYSFAGLPRRRLGEGGLYHWAESSDHLGETSGYLAKRTMLNTVNQLGEGVTSMLHDRG
jgi:hypothetical protein